jgi:hypothetical protein
MLTPKVDYTQVPTESLVYLADVSFNKREYPPGPLLAELWKRGVDIPVDRALFSMLPETMVNSILNKIH